MGSLKNGYLDHSIGLSIKKYTFTRILVSGHDQTRALPPHPTVLIYANNWPKRQKRVRADKQPNDR